MPNQYIIPGQGFLNEGAAGTQYISPGQGFVNEPANPATNVNITGVVATGQVGSVTLSVSIAPISVAGVGVVGTLIGGAVAISGAAGIGIAATLTPSVSVFISGVTASGAVGSVAFNPRAVLVGAVGTGHVGTITTQSTGQTTTLASVEGIGIVGLLSFSGTSPTLTGVFATGYVGALTFTVVAKAEVVGYSHIIGSELINYFIYSPEDQIMAVQFQTGIRITYRSVPYYTALQMIYTNTPDLYYQTAIAQLPTI